MVATRAKTALIARLRKLCMALPEANEKVSHGEPTWFAGKGKVFAMLDDHHHGGAHLSVWLPQPLGRQEDLIDGDPDRFFRPPYVGPSGWVGVVLDTGPDWAMVEALITEAYRHVARPKLAAKLDGVADVGALSGRPPPSGGSSRGRRSPAPPRRRRRGSAGVS